MRRWSLRILIGLAALIILIVVVVQLVLWSQLPKDIVTKQIEQELGLRISCKRLTTSWLGRTTLSDVSIGLPLAEKSFLNVQTLKVKHSSLFGLILTRAISINYIEIDKPDVIVLQDANGQWNLAEVAELLGRVGGGNTGQQSASSGVPKLPNVRLIDGTVRVVDNSHHTATLAPVNVNGYAVGSLVWEYDLSVSDSISVIGKLAPGNNWQHQLKLTAHHLDTLARGWGIDSYGADVAATWDGQLTDGGAVTGTLNLDHASAAGVPGAGTVNASGAISVVAGGNAAAPTGAGAGAATVAVAPGAAPAPAISATATTPLLTIKPIAINITTTLPTLPNLKLGGGALTDDDAGVHVRNVQLSALGGFALINASFNPTTFAADLDTRWTGLRVQDHISHSGSLLASLRMPFQAHPEISVQLTSHGTVSANKWDAQVLLVGAGQSWKDIDWVLTAPQLKYTGSQSVEFADLVGHVSQRLPTIELTNLTLPARPHLRSAAKVDLSNKDWFFRLDAGGAPKAEGFVVPLDFNIDASGNQDLYTLNSANVLVADTTVHAKGFYDRREPNPVKLEVSVTQPPELPPNAAIQGHLGGHLTISGKLFKEAMVLSPDLNVNGELTSSDLVILNRSIGDFDGHLVGDVKGDDWDTHLYTTQMSLFGGQWKLAAHRPTSDGGVEATLEVSNLPVEQLARLANLQNVGGTITEGSWTLVVPASPRLDTITLHSTPTRIVALHGFNVTADSVELLPQLSDGIATVDIGATCGPGKMRSKLTCDLLSPKHIGADLQVENWPYRAAPDSSASIVASVKPSHFDLDLGQKNPSLAGAIDASADVRLGSTSLAHAELAASVQGRALTISRLSGRVLNGTFDGDTIVDVDNPLAATGQIRWFDIDASALVPLAPSALDGLGGVYSGTVTIAPARDPRPYEPVRIDVNVAADHAHFRSVQIGSHRLVAVHAVGYANLDRVILENSDIDVAGGMAHLQARMSQTFSSEDLRLSFENLQLDQLAHALPQFKGKPMPGLLTGNIHLMGSGADTTKIAGSSDLTLAAADLGNFGPIAALYNAMHPGGGPQAPEGTGEISLAYEQNAIRVTNFHYFNRGIDAHGIFQVGPSILTLPNTPLVGQVAGSAQPLSNTSLPFLGDFNDIFSAVQKNLTTIDVSGTVDKPNYGLAGLNQIGDSLKEMLVGSARSDNGN